MNYSFTSKQGAPCGAYLLAGGASKRMGHDKALLLFQGETLLVRSAKLLLSIAPHVLIVAPQGRYEGFGFQTVQDVRPNCGPLAGVETVLLDSVFEWNLIVACDLPFLTRDWLLVLLKAADEAGPATGCVCTAGNPLVAAWNRSAISTVQQALDEGRFRMRDLMLPLNAKNLIPPDPQILANWNRPEDVHEHPSEGKANLDC